MRSKAIKGFVATTLATVVVFKILKWDASFPREAAMEKSQNEPYIPTSLKDAPMNRPADAPSRFLIEEADFCQRFPDLYIISYIFSAISDIEKRNISRNTWAGSHIYHKYGIKMASVFVVGRSKNTSEERVVRDESERYHDIIQGDFVDSYELLPYKGLASLVWITRHCTHIPWTFHADDDVLIDPFLLNKMTKEFERKQQPSQFYCDPFRFRKVSRVGKWRVPLKIIAFERYPDFCHGPTWFIPTVLAKPLLDASQRINFLWVDDAYLTGLVAREAGIPAPTNIVRKYFSNDGITDFHVGRKFAWHGVTQDRMKFWEKIVTNHAGKFEN